MGKKNFCKECGLESIYHIQTWTDELIDRFLPRLSLPRTIEIACDIFLEKFLGFLGLVKLKDNFAPSDIQMRSACFIEEARVRGVKFQAIKGPFGYTNHFCAKMNEKTIRFESLPIADFAGKHSARFVDCKERTKKHLKKGNFPIAEGKAFWFWQKGQATKYGAHDLGFPLVIKPRGGSVARHVATDVKSEEDLKQAINNAIVYSPAFIIERFIRDSFVYRATVVDFDYVACVKQEPANVTGDGHSTIQELVYKKNKDKRRGEPHQKEFILYKLVMDDATEKLAIPREGETVYLQKNPFLKLGGDLVEVTGKVHPDNIQLFKDVARFFDIRIVGIDFLVPDISLPWKTQRCAILELNSVPCIEMHHYPSSGTAQNVAGAVVDLFFKYYL